MLVRNMAELNTIIEKKYSNQIVLYDKATMLAENIAFDVSEVPFTITDKLNGDQENPFYWINEKDQYFLTKLSLELIAKAAGIRFYDGRILKRDTDKENKVIFFKHALSYEYFRADGSTIKSQVTGEYDYYRDLETFAEIENRYSQIHNRFESINESIVIRRRVSGSIAEGNAKRRALAEIFPRLKSPFNEEELIHPFLVTKAVYDKEEILRTNPEFRKLYIAKMLDLSNDLFFPWNDYSIKPANTSKINSNKSMDAHNIKVKGPNNLENKRAYKTKHGDEKGRANE